MGEKLYTIGEIYQNKMMVDFKGQPYKHKVSVARLVNRENFKTIRTPWGLAKCLSQKQIDKINREHNFSK